MRSSADTALAAVSSQRLSADVSHCRSSQAGDAAAGQLQAPAECKSVAQHACKHDGWQQGKFMTALWAAVFVSVVSAVCRNGSEGQWLVCRA